MGISIGDESVRRLLLVIKRVILVERAVTTSGFLAGVHILPIPLDLFRLMAIVAA